MSLLKPEHLCYLYQLFKTNLGLNRQAALERVDAVLLQDALSAHGLGYADTRELCESYPDIFKVTAFKKGAVFVTVLPCELFEQGLQETTPAQTGNARKPWKKKKHAKEISPRKPKLKVASAPKAQVANTLKEDPSQQTTAEIHEPTHETSGDVETLHNLSESSEKLAPQMSQETAEQPEHTIEPADTSAIEQLSDPIAAPAEASEELSCNLAATDASRADQAHADIVSETAPGGVLDGAENLHCSDDQTVPTATCINAPAIQLTILSQPEPVASESLAERIAQTPLIRNFLHETVLSDALLDIMVNLEETVLPPHEFVYEDVCAALKRNLISGNPADIRISTRLVSQERNEPLWIRIFKSRTHAHQKWLVDLCPDADQHTRYCLCNPYDTCRSSSFERATITNALYNLYAHVDKLFTADFQTSVGVTSAVQRDALALRALYTYTAAVQMAPHRHICALPHDALDSHGIPYVLTLHVDTDRPTFFVCTGLEQSAHELYNPCAETACGLSKLLYTDEMLPEYIAATLKLDPRLVIGGIHPYTLKPVLLLPSERPGHVLSYTVDISIKQYSKAQFLDLNSARLATQALNSHIPFWMHTSSELSDEKESL